MILHRLEQSWDSDQDCGIMLLHQLIEFSCVELRDQDDLCPNGKRVVDTYLQAETMEDRHDPQNDIILAQIR